jgi:hypothetical protein
MVSHKVEKSRSLGGVFEDQLCMEQIPVLTFGVSKITFCKTIKFDLDINLV